MKKVEIGARGRSETMVTPENTAQAVGSGLVPVFGTPYMAALMENAASGALLAYLEADEGSVGTRLEISHDSATPVGMKVWAEAEVVEAEGKRVVFRVAAYDEAGPIGQGRHERFVIKPSKFLARAEAKLCR